MAQPLVTVAVPSYNQGRFLEQALASIFASGLALEVFVLDGGSIDNSAQIIEKWAPRLAGWRSHKDSGQAAAINEGIAMGRASYVCWLNSDDWFLPGGLARLVNELEQHLEAPAVYGRAWDVDEITKSSTAVWTEPFSERRLAMRCIVSQPATLIRRTAWEAVGGLNERLQLALDYELWWKLYKKSGPLHYLQEFVAANRNHDETKTNVHRVLGCTEAIQVIEKYHGRIPVKWRLTKLYETFLHYASA